MRGALVALSVLLGGGVVVGQPPLPPAARPHDMGTVQDIEPGQHIVLSTGLVATLDGDTQTIPPQGDAEWEVVPGDLVELAYNERGNVGRIIVLPQCSKRLPLVNLPVQAGSVSRTFWQAPDGTDHPDSLRTSEATFDTRDTARQLTGTAAYDAPTEDAPRAVFEIVAGEPLAGAVLWRKELAPGDVVPFRCYLRRMPLLFLTCAASEGEELPEAACVWASPTLVLRELEAVPLRPAVAEQVADALLAGLGGLDPGALVIGVPEVIGLSADVGRDLQDDLFVALARRQPVVGRLPNTTAWSPSADEQAATAAMGGNSIVVAKIRYGPRESTVAGRIVTVPDGEQLATAEATF